MSTKNHFYNTANCIKIRLFLYVFYPFFCKTQHIVVVFLLQHKSLKKFNFLSCFIFFTPWGRVLKTLHKQYGVFSSVFCNLFCMFLCFVMECKTFLMLKKFCTRYTHAFEKRGKNEIIFSKVASYKDRLFVFFNYM